MRAFFLVISTVVFGTPVGVSDKAVKNEAAEVQRLHKLLLLELDGKLPAAEKQRRAKLPPSPGHRTIGELGNYGPKAAPAIPALIRALKSGDTNMRISASFSLNQIGVAAVPALTETLKHKNKWARFSAAHALGQIGPKAESAIPDLLKMLSKPDADCRGTAAEALGSIGRRPDKTVPAIVRLLKDKDVAVRSLAAKALGILGPKAKAAVPDLIRLLQDPNKGENPRATILMSLGQIGHVTDGVIPAFAQALKDKDVCVRWGSACGLAVLGASAKPAIPAMIEVLEQAPLRSAATFSSEKKYANWYLNRLTVGCCIGTLGELGPAAKSALPVLKRIAAKHQEQRVRTVASEAIAKISITKSPSKR